MFKKKNKKGNKTYIDRQFSNLIDFIKKHSEEELVNSIKHNFKYISNKNPRQYKNIINFYNEHKMWGTIDLDSGDYTLIENNARSLFQNWRNYEWLYNKLDDYRSKKILTTILTYWLMMDYSKLPQIIDQTYNQYFDLDLIKCDENEVFVDIGSYIGDTLVDYIKTFGKNYKNIYCYEIVPANIEYIKKNIELFKINNVTIRELGVSDKNGSLFLDKDEVSSISKLKSSGQFEVKTTTIDEDIKKPVTFIKMDIEGAEEKALLGCQQQIKKHHPKLAICVYHNNDHLWRLAKIIDELNPNYKFYLRYYGGPFLPTEYLLYAI